MILLNPGPANTTSTVKEAMTRPDICPREKEFGDVMLHVLDSLVRVVHEGDAYVAVLFTGSGTAAVEAAVCSTVPDTGRLLVIDNGAYGRRIVDIAAACRIDHDAAVFGAGGYPEVDRIAHLLDRQHYTHLAVVHNETSTGMLNPVEEVGQLCRERGVEMIVDAMSSYAGIPIDIESMGAGLLVSSSNKCIQGMAGISFVVCRRGLLEALEPIPGRSLYLSIPLQHRYMEEEQQMRYTPPVQVIYALDQALDEYFSEGGIARHDRYMANWSTLDGGMRRLGFRHLLPESLMSRIVTAYLEPENDHYDFDEMHDRLYSKGFTIYPGKGAGKATFRLANMGAVNPDDMRSFLGAMKETVEEMKLYPLYGK